MSQHLEPIFPQSPSVPTGNNTAGRQVYGTADSAIAAGIRAQVEARYLMAMHRPRDLDEVRERVLKECRRPSFAEGAMYALPRGGKTIPGLSIRFAEAAARCFTNINCETYVIYDDEQKRILRVQVTDVECNESFARDITVSKTVERAHIRQGQIVLGTRANSQGRTTYLVSATEDEFAAKEGAMTSKAIRTLLLRIIPGWLQDEAQEAIVQTVRDRDAKDPDSQKRRLLDSFNSIGVNTAAIKEYLGRTEIDLMTPQEVTELRGVYSAIREGYIQWSTVLTERKSERQAGSEPQDDATKGTKAALKMLRDKKAASEVADV